MNERVRNRLLLLAAATLFSTGGAAIKAASITSWQVASFRSGIAALALMLLVPAARRGWTWKLAPVGLAYAATLVLFVLSTRLTTGANAIFLQSTAPLYLLLLAPLLLHEHIRRGDLFFIGAIGVGMALVLLGGQNAARHRAQSGVGRSALARCRDWRGRSPSRACAGSAATVRRTPPLPPSPRAI